MPIALAGQVETALIALKEGLREIYGPRLKRLVLYGSHARGAAGPDSDIDVAVVLDGPIHIGREITRTSNLRQRINLDTGQLVSLIYLSPETFRDGQRLIYRNIRREGIEL